MASRTEIAAMRTPVVVIAALLAVAWMSRTLLAVPASSSAQSYRQQPGIFPVFDGWETSPDGSRLLYFGYMNRHPREVMVPIGSGNGFEPGSVDRGQPENFLPGRQKHVLTVKVPADFKDKLVWTLTSEAGVHKANASLNQLYIVEEIEDADPGASVAAPQVKIVDAHMTVKVSDTLPLRPQIEAAVSDQPTGVVGSSATDGGLTVWWSKYRGPGTVAFGAAAGAGRSRAAASDGREPGTFAVACVVPPEPACGAATARFAEPGEYLLRILARRRRVTRAPVAQFIEGSATVRVTVNP
jgi:hypothetical protein